MSSYRRRRKSIGTVVLLLVAVVLAAACVVLLFLYKKESDSDVASENVTGSDVINVENDTSTEVVIDDNADGLYISADEARRLYGLTDIQQTVNELSVNVNPDIYAVVSIPGCDIEEPVCQRADDELYYTSHNETGADDENGCVFTQVFNTKDFTDNLTVMYGRNTGNGERFSNLHFYEDSLFMDENPYIYVYTDSDVLIYQVYGAFTFKALHLIMVYDTNNADGYANFVNEFTNLNLEINDNVSDQIKLSTDKKTLILSTGVAGNMDLRYLVSGVLVARTHLE